MSLAFIAFAIGFSASDLTFFTSASSFAAGVHVIFGTEFLAISSSWSFTCSRMPACATLSASTTSASEISSAPPSTIRTESAEPATVMSMLENSSCWNVGLRTHWFSIRPTRTAAIGPCHGTSDIDSAAETPIRAGMLASFS